MKKQDSVYLIDELGNEHERKNLYLRDFFNNNNSSINKSNHPYMVEYKAFKTREKTFLKSLKNEVKELPKELLPLEKKLFTATKKEEFYKEYQTLDYEAEYLYKENEIKSRVLPEIIEYYKSEKTELDRATNQLKNINNEKENKLIQEHKSFIKHEKEKLDKLLTELKNKEKQGLISHKAYETESERLKHRSQEDIKLHSGTISKNHLKDEIRSKKYNTTKALKDKLIVLNSNIADLRRAIPYETMTLLPYKAFLTLFIPGLGQFLNKQYEKAGLFIFATLFIYLAAIPYSLGFGNYQGTGISGLISLAQGARRVDRSLIFLIEGLVAIFLVIISIVLLILNFKDVRSTEKAAIKGERPRNWFETKQSLENDGFPYLVMSPAYLVVIFIVLIPIVTSILMSFTGMDPQNQAKFSWVGISNYKMLVSGQGMAGSIFWIIFGWTLIWTFVATSSAVFVGFTLALLVNNDRVKGKVIFRAIYILPWAVPGFITVLFFSVFLAPNGAITEILTNLFGTRIHVKTDPMLSRIALILIQTWLGSAYVFILSTGVLQSISSDLYEAAQIDGASSFQKLTKITIPMVLFQTAPLLVGQYTFNFNNFNIIYLFNGGGPFNPEIYGNLAGSTDILVSYIFKLVMDNQYQSMGAAITVIISIGLIIFAFLGFKNSKAFKEESQ